MTFRRLAGRRDRALIGTLVYSFARIGASLAMKVDDYFPEGKRWKLRLHEKGGKEHVVPVHHTLEEYLDAYLAAAGTSEQNDDPLLRTLSTAPDRPLSLEPMTQPDAWRMTCPPEACRRSWIRRRARNAGTKTKIGPPSPRVGHAKWSAATAGKLPHFSSSEATSV